MKDSTYVLQAAETLMLNIKSLRSDQIIILKKEISKKFLNGKTFDLCYPLFEYITDTISFQYEFSWQFIPEILKDNTNLILFFEPNDDDAVFCIDNSNQIVRIMEESPKMTFYITDVNYSFLLGYNDHDYLVGSSQLKDLFILFSEKNGIEIF